MKTASWMTVPVFLMASGASMADPFGAISFRVEHDQHGPYAGMVVEGKCAVDLAGSPSEQSTRCVMDVKEPTRQGYRRLFHMLDRQALVRVANGNVLKIAMGLPTAASGMGTWRPDILAIKSVSATPMVLTDGATVLPGAQPIANELRLGPYSEDNPDCLIFDILGGNTYDDPT